MNDQRSSKLGLTKGAGEQTFLTFFNRHRHAIGMVAIIIFVALSIIAVVGAILLHDNPLDDIPEGAILVNWSLLA